MGIGSWFLVVKWSCLELTFLFTNLELNSPYNTNIKKTCFSFINLLKALAIHRANALNILITYKIILILVHSLVYNLVYSDIIWKIIY